MRIRQPGVQRKIGTLMANAIKNARNTQAECGYPAGSIVLEPSQLFARSRTCCRMRIKIDNRRRHQHRSSHRIQEEFNGE